MERKRDENRASTFLPLRIALARRRDRVNLHPRRLVVVADDDARTRQLLVRHLRPLDCDVLEARDGKEAVRMALAHEPDLLVVDVRMPGLSGYEVTREVRRRLPAHVRILLISGLSADMSEAFEAGADAYLRKPFGGTEVREQVQALFESAGSGGPGSSGHPR
jgi:two-component system response regulator ResD